jgi:hypothetical protein
MNLKQIKSSFSIPVFVLVLLSTMAASCSEDKEDKDNYTVSVDVKEITLTTTSQSQELKITSSGEWHFEAQGLQGGFGINMGSTDWYTLTPMYGDNNQTATITLKEGVTTDKTTSLKVVGENNSEKISLKFSAQ